MIPLYQQLVDLPTIPETKNWWTATALLPEDHLVNIYVLILAYAEKEGLPLQKNLYGGLPIDNNRGLTFQVKNFPEPLQIIIQKYITIVTQSGVTTQQ